MRRPSSLVLVLAAVAALGVGAPRDGLAHGPSPVLHEPIDVDPAEDFLVGASAEGEIPPAMKTPGGVVQAPDVSKPAGAREPAYTTDGAAAAAGARGAVDGSRFVPDRDTRRPDVLPYDDPFTPSTAPFKRLVAFDAVDAAGALRVRDERLRPVPTRGEATTDGSEEAFYANLVVDAAPGRRVRIPTVAAGTRILRARSSNGAELHVFQDGAENWFLEADRRGRLRVVLQIAAPRASFGGDFAAARWADLPPVAPLPPNLQAEAAVVASTVGVSRTEPPRDVVARLVAYFREFVDSPEAQPEKGDVYLDLALSKKGVCRHRAFAFVVTALGLGLPTRMVLNEAHAWVEVHDGTAWRRIDLGGAGRALREPLGGAVAQEAPRDPFAWPTGAARGEELASRSRATTNRAPSDRGPVSEPLSGPNGSDEEALEDGERGRTRDERPRASVALAVTSRDPRRGAPLALRGEVRADGAPCGNVPVQIYLRAPKDSDGDVPLGALATDGRGVFEGALVVPRSVPLGDYDLVARTTGDARCGRGEGP